MRPARSSVIAISLMASAVLILFGLHSDQPSEISGEPTPWSVRTATSGIVLYLDRTTPELRDARNIELVIREGRRTYSHRLGSHTGTIIIPFNQQPFSASLRVTGGAKDGQTFEVFAKPKRLQKS